MLKSLKAIWVVVSTSFRAASWRTALVIVLDVLIALSLATPPLWLKLIVDAAIAKDLQKALIVAAINALTIMFSLYAEWIETDLIQIVQERSILLINRQLIELSLNLDGLEHHERPEYQNELSLILEGRTLLSQSFTLLLESLSIFIGGATTILLLISIHPVLLFLPLGGLALWAGSRKAAVLRRRAYNQTAEQLRLRELFFDLATSSQSVKELHIFNLRESVLERHQKISVDADAVRTKAELLGAMFRSTGWLLFTLGYAAAVVFVVSLAMGGSITPGNVILTLGLAAQVNGYTLSGANQLSSLSQMLDVVLRYLWLKDYALSTQHSNKHFYPVPSEMKRGIEFKGVTFRYPGASDDVLTNLHLHIPAGSTVALVGENGAGKTTLVKLICRFYKPAEGKITVDDIDIQQFDINKWRARIAVGFQDFCRFELLVRETVGVGDISHVEDSTTILQAMRSARADELLTVLPDGLETQLGKKWEGGVDLSGGQWQKLALSRTVMRQKPLLLVLDEPTANLDAVAEYTLFKHYAEAATHVSTCNGGITLFVSHRFSTIQMADLILVMKGGHIVEQGSHTELINAKGLYAELYELQAQGYK